MTDSSKVINYSYTAYGDLLPDSSTPNTFGYNAEATDFNTGLQYLRARYYNTNTGRFIQKDEYKGDFTQPSTLNRYAYCAGNPVNRIDPSGNRTVEGAGGGNPSTPTTEMPVKKNEPEYTSCQKDEDESEVMIVVSIWKPLDNEWYYRIDPANEGTHTQRHIHFKKGDDTDWQSENEDTTIHDKGKGKKVPNKVKKKAKNKGIWGPKKKGEKKNTVKINKQAKNTAIGVGLVVVATIAVVVLVADDVTGIGAVDDPLIAPAVGLLTKGIQLLIN